MKKDEEIELKDTATKEIISSQAGSPQVLPMMDLENGSKCEGATNKNKIFT